MKRIICTKYPSNASKSKDDYKWRKYRAPKGNWTDDRFNEMEDMGLRSSDFKASTLDKMLEIGAKLGADCELVDTLPGDDATFIVYHTDSHEAGLFLEYLGTKRFIEWSRSDYDFTDHTLTVHFRK